MLEYKKVFLFNGKDITTLNEQEKKEAREYLSKERIHIPCINTDNDELVEFMRCLS